MELDSVQTQSTLADSGSDFVCFKSIPIDSIVVGERIRHDPTRNIDSLVKSIEALGLLEPIVVRQQEGNGKVSYFLQAGERRIEALRRMGKKEIPAQIRQTALGRTKHEELA